MFNFFESCADEETQEQLDLGPLVWLLQKYNLTVPMEDDQPTKQSLNLTHTLMFDTFFFLKKIFINNV